MPTLPMPETALKLEESLRRILDVLPNAVTVQDREGDLIYANDAAARVVGFETPAEMIAAGGLAVMDDFTTTNEDGSPLAVDDLPGRRVLDGKAAEPIVLRSVHLATGRLRWTRTHAVPIHDADGTVAFAVNLIEDISDVKLVEIRQRVLAEAGQLLSDTPDLDQTFQEVARLAVPEVAQWCAFDIPDGQGGVRLAALAHADPEKVSLGREMRTRYPPDLSADRGVARALAGQCEYFPEIPEELLEQSAQSEEHLAMVRAVGIRSAIIVPVRSGEEVLGVLSLVDGARSFTPADVEFAEDLGRRVGQAIAVSKLFEQRSLVARTLQAALQPPTLPDVPGWELATLFKPAEGEVGGDFYDLFFAPESWWLVVGDVCGRGPTAAALTSMVRYSLRSAAQLRDDPARAARYVNEVLLDHGDLALSSVVVLRVARMGGTELLCAGHPPAALLAGGEVAWRGSPGPMLGAYADVEWGVESVPLDSGEAVVLYTDGVPDLPGKEGRFGEAGLIDALAQGAEGPHEVLGVLEARMDAFASGPSADDAAVVCAQRI